MFHAIVAIGKNREMWYQGKLPWDFKQDMHYFKEQTKGAIVIMWRKTFESLGKPLPNRINVVLSSQELDLPEGVLLFHTLEEVTTWYSQTYPNHEKIWWIIWWAQLFQEAIKQGLIDALYVTKIDGTYQADTYFPVLEEEFHLVSSTPVEDTNRLTQELTQLEFQEYQLN